MRKPLEKVPDDHRHFRGDFHGETEDGQLFILVVRDAQRRMGSGELMKAHIKAMTRGRPMMPQDAYASETKIALFVNDRIRKDIEILPSGMYRSGRRVERSLRKIVGELLDEMKPRSAPAP